MTAVSKTNAPPFDGPNTQCYLSQFNNAIYVINGDNANPLNVHVFDPTAQAWTVQPTIAGGVDPTTVQAILDHDTNVFCELGTIAQSRSLALGTNFDAQRKSADLIARVYSWIKIL